MGGEVATGRTYRSPLTSLTSRVGPHLRSLLLMRRIVLSTLTLFLTLGVATATPLGAQTSPSTDAVAEADATIAQLRQQADALAGRYFEGLGQLATVQQRIDDIEARLPALADQVATLRALTQDRAVAAYKRSGNDLASVMGAGNPMEAARRVQWLGLLNARDGALSDELRATSSRLAGQRTELRQARESAAASLDDVKAQGQAIDALLVDAQERRRVAATPPTTAAPDPGTAAPSSVTVAAPTTTTTAPKATPPAAPPTYVPTPGTHPAHNEPFLVCTRTREASGNYAAYNPAGPYLGAYQFLQSSWNGAANHAGRPDLIGVPPNTASQYDQDDVAWSLYQWRGSGPWGGMCDPS